MQKCIYCDLQTTLQKAFVYDKNAPKVLDFADLKYLVRCRVKVCDRENLWPHYFLGPKEKKIEDFTNNLSLFLKLCARDVRHILEERMGSENTMPLFHENYMNEPFLNENERFFYKTIVFWAFLVTSCTI